MSRDERFLEPTEVKVLPCIRCNRILEGVEVNSPNHPYDAVVFRAYGQYGSTQFDPGDGSYLEINVCDHCLMLLAKSSVASFPPEKKQEESKSERSEVADRIFSAAKQWIEDEAKWAFEAEQHNHPRGHTPDWDLQPDHLKEIFRQKVRNRGVS